MTLHIAIITPTYNRAELLSRAIASVLAQEHRNWTMYVIDDGSTDHTAEVMANHAGDRRICYQRQAVNCGVNAARNAALEAALAVGADLVTLLDDDDVFLPHALGTAAQVAEKHPGKGWFVTGNSVNTSKPTALGSEGEADYITDCIYGDRIRGDTTHFIRATLIGLTRFSLHLRQAEEWIFFFGLAVTQKMYIYPGIATHKEYRPTGLLASRPNYKQRHCIRLQMATIALQLRPHCRAARREQFRARIRTLFRAAVTLEVIDAAGNRYP